MPALPKIDADQLRSQLLDGTAVHIANKYVKGKLDLADCTGVGGSALPPLSLENCDIPDEIDLSNARLARFSIRRTRITHIHARGVRIDGPFDFSEVEPYSDFFPGRRSSMDRRPRRPD
jgi:hypothetical protein